LKTSDVVANALGDYIVDIVVPGRRFATASMDGYYCSMTRRHGRVAGGAGRTYICLSFGASELACDIS
jgi:hypothetical protein